MARAIPYLWVTFDLRTSPSPAPTALNSLSTNTSNNFVTDDVREKAIMNNQFVIAWGECWLISATRKRGSWQEWRLDRPTTSRPVISTRTMILAISSDIPDLQNSTAIKDLLMWNLIHSRYKPCVINAASSDLWLEYNISVSQGRSAETKVGYYTVLDRKRMNPTSCYSLKH